MNRQSRTFLCAERERLSHFRCRLGTRRRKLPARQLQRRAGCANRHRAAQPRRRGRDRGTRHNAVATGLAASRRPVHADTAQARSCVLLDLGRVGMVARVSVLFTLRTDRPRDAARWLARMPPRGRCVNRPCVAQGGAQHSPDQSWTHRHGRCTSQHAGRRALGQLCAAQRVCVVGRGAADGNDALAHLGRASKGAGADEQQAAEPSPPCC